ncbi:MAG TPA: thiamine ABC transporter substrate-binding protein [Pseudolysinimonas sp.]|nr:thiamine ABC transporter substrate-binding protein [Pseudolysinimonas sp.]
MQRFIPLAAIAASAVLLAGCTAPADAPATLVLVTHDSFALSEGTLEQFTEETGVVVDVQSAGDAGELVNKLVLTKDSPLGDVVFGIDNTFASRAASNGVLEKYVSGDLTDAEAPYLLPAGSGGEYLTPIDSGDVCVNVDHEWFTEAGLAEPQTLDDLIDPAYEGLLVVEAANSSSPGLAFLLATIAAYGDGWPDYWSALVDNQVKVAASWSDAYYVDFSGPSSEGDRPLVVSYASSPPFESGATGVLLDTCFRQTEYAGVITGTEHPAEARQLVDFLFSTVVQNDIPENMYVFPVNSEATLPETWADYAEVAADPYVIDPTEIDANRERWIAEWAAIATP